MSVSKIFFMIFAWCFCAFSSFSQEVMFEGEENGVLLLSVVEYNIKKKEAAPQAIQDAYFQILFRGIPGSKEYQDALLGTNEDLKNEQLAYYNKMVRGRIYSFIPYCVLNYYKKKTAIVKLSVNVRALVADLERNNLYRRFGLY